MKNKQNQNGVATWKFGYQRREANRTAQRRCICSPRCLIGRQRRTERGGGGVFGNTNAGRDDQISESGGNRCIETETTCLLPPPTAINLLFKFKLESWIVKLGEQIFLYCCILDNPMAHLLTAKAAEQRNQEVMPTQPSDTILNCARYSSNSKDHNWT